MIIININYVYIFILNLTLYKPRLSDVNGLSVLLEDMHFLSTFIESNSMSRWSFLKWRGPQNGKRLQALQSRTSRSVSLEYFQQKVQGEEIIQIQCFHSILKETVSNLCTFVFCLSCYSLSVGDVLI